MLKQFCYLLLGAHHKFLIWTDHQNLKYFKSPQKITPCQAQWHEFLQDYNFKLEHFPGKSNTITDLLSQKKRLWRGSKSQWKCYNFARNLICMRYLPQEQPWNAKTNSSSGSWYPYQRSSQNQKHVESNQMQIHRTWTMPICWKLYQRLHHMLRIKDHHASETRPFVPLRYPCGRRTLPIRIHGSHHRSTDIKQIWCHTNDRRSRMFQGHKVPTM